MGVLLGWLLSFGIVANSFDGTLGYEDAGVLFFYSLFGLIFPRIIGTSLSVIQAGSALGGVISLFTGNSYSLFANILIFIVSFAGQHLIILVRRNASASVGAASPLRFPALRAKNSNLFSRNLRASIQSEFWDDLELDDNELPQGVLALKYQIPKSTIEQLQANDDKLTLHYLADDHYRTCVVRFTTKTIFFKAPQGEAVVKYLTFSFTNDFKLPFKDISELRIVETNSENSVLNVKVTNSKFDVNFDFSPMYKTEVKNLIYFWERSTNEFNES
jgi:hypothetical protein